MHHQVFALLLSLTALGAAVPANAQSESAEPAGITVVEAGAQFAMRALEKRGMLRETRIFLVTATSMEYRRINWRLTDIVAGTTDEGAAMEGELIPIDDECRLLFYSIDETADESVAASFLLRCEGDEGSG